MSLALLGILNSQAAGGAEQSLDHLSTQILGSTSTSVSFTGLNTLTDYKHLSMVVTARGAEAIATNWHLIIRLNGDTSNNYDSMSVGNYQNSPTSGENFGNRPGIYFERYIPQAVDANYYGATVLDFNDFLNTTKYISVQSVGGGHSVGAKSAFIGHGNLRSTAALNTIELRTDSGWGPFVAGSRFSLYGRK